MQFALAVGKKVHESKLIPTMKANGEDKAMSPKRYEEESSEPQSYVRVPVWMIVMMSTILITLIGTIISTIWFAATIRSDVSNLNKTIDGQASTSIQSQINELRKEIHDNDEKVFMLEEANKERINQIRLELAKIGRA